MYPRSLLLTIFVGVAGVLSAQPTVTQIQNNYSYLLPSNSSYGIAQGSIFIIKGSNLANASTGLQSSPLHTSLEGVSAKVTVSGVTTDVIWYYVTPGQLGGILPSSTPAGTGTITVNNNGQMSAPAQIRVVQSAFGILTLDGSGTGAAAVYDASYQFLGSTNSTKPGDIIQLFGTGLGPVDGDETTYPQTQTDLSNIPISVQVAGVNGTVLYHGRTQFPGLDQINVRIPALSDSQYGCAVSLNVQIGDFSSNATTIPVAANGGTCPQPPTGGGGGDNGDNTITQEEINSWIAAGVFRSGNMSVGKTTTYTITDSFTGGSPTSATTVSSFAGATFYRISGDLNGYFNSPNNSLFNQAGTCLTFTGTSFQNLFPGLTYTSMDAGTPLTVSGPNGLKNMPRQTDSVGGIYYSADVDSGYAVPGQYTFTGPGGPDVGSFSGSITVAQDFNWTNRAGHTVIDRTQPLTITWSGGEPSTLVSIQGQSLNPSNLDAVAGFFCYANNTDGSFTVPVSILQQLQPSSSIQAGAVTVVQRGTLSVSNVGKVVRLHASGLDYFAADNQWTTTQSAQYK